MTPDVPDITAEQHEARCRAALFAADLSRTLEATAELLSGDGELIEIAISARGKRRRPLTHEDWRFAEALNTRRRNATPPLPPLPAFIVRWVRIEKEPTSQSWPWKYSGLVVPPIDLSHYA